MPGQPVSGTQGVRGDCQAGIDRGRSRHHAAVHHVQVFQTPEAALGIERRRSRIGAHTYRAHRVGEGVDAVPDQSPGPCMAENGAGAFDESTAGRPVAFAVPMGYLESGQANAVGSNAVQENPVLVLRLVFGDRQKTGEVVHPSRADRADDRGELGPDQTDRRRCELLYAPEFPPRIPERGVPEVESWMASCL